MPAAVHALHHREGVMGTIVTIDVFTADGSAGREISAGLATAREILQQADAVFSTWKPGSAVSRLRRGEITLAEAPAEVAEVVRACALARELSGGWFDPWAMPGGLDPTGLVKGWAAQRAAAALQVPGAAGAIVNAAGDIASFGALGPGAPFRIGIADPFARRRLTAIVHLNGAIATSGSYERGEHLIDPHSGCPAARVASASVTGPDLGHGRCARDRARRGRRAGAGPGRPARRLRSADHRTGSWPALDGGFPVRPGGGAKRSGLGGRVAAMLAT